MSKTSAWALLASLALAACDSVGVIGDLVAEDGAGAASDLPEVESSNSTTPVNPDLGDNPSGDDPSSDADTDGNNDADSDADSDADTDSYVDCDQGTTTTQWAIDCLTGPPACTAGSWTNGGPEPTNSDLTYRTESEHFVIYAQSHISLDSSTMNSAFDYMENTVWGTFFGDPMYMKEPYCDSSTKYKNVIHIRDDVGLQGGAWHDGSMNHMGMWVGPAALQDFWGLPHEFMHGVQAVAGGLSCGGSQNYCGWWYESHANWAAHQVNDDDVHCSELFVNATHLHLGNLRNRYCNWQFAEFLKDKYCYSAVNEIWTDGSDNDPFSQIMNNMGWSISDLNDFLGEWAMHNITWDYKNPTPTDGSNKSNLFLSAYGTIDSTSGGWSDRGQRRQRITRLEALDDNWESNHRFVTNYYWAPQRWGYNVVELFPESDASEITVNFKGVVQSGANSEWRYGVVATDSNFTTARYSGLHTGTGEASSLRFCISSGERIWLVVMATPSVQVQINWDDHNYPSLYRYPWMVELQNAWPAGFQNRVKTCAEGSPHSNGGGCVSGGSVDSSAYVGPYAQVLGGAVSGNARIEDHAIVLSGSVTDHAVVGGLTVLSGFNVSGSAVVRATFMPIGYFGASSASGTAELLGDLECYSNKSSGSYTGFVNDSTGSISLNEVTTPPPYSW